jgi:hypothetical protein
MRPLPQTRNERFAVKSWQPRLRHLALVSVLLTVGAWTLGCGGGGAGSVTPPPPPPPSIITISITPSNRTAFLGETLTFAATVSNASDTAVAWSVNSISGGSPQVGTISADGSYGARLFAVSGLTNATLNWSVNGRRQCDLREDLRCRLQAVPDCNQQRRFAGELSRAGRDSLAQSFFDRRHQRQQFLAQLFHAGYRHQPHCARTRNLMTSNPSSLMSWAISSALRGVKRHDVSVCARTRNLLGRAPIGASAGCTFG